MVPTFARTGDKRRSSRARVKLRARYASPNLSLEGQVTDVSSEGLFFCSDFLDAEGEMARVFIDVPPGQQPIEVRGEVRWVSDETHGGGMGIRLVDVSIEDRVRLARVAAGTEGETAVAVTDGAREGNA